MSYIIKTTNPAIRVKLTEKGREKLATGQLTFSKWAVGDSEVNYGYTSPNSPMVNEYVLRPKDEQPNIKHFLTQSNGDIFSNLNSSNLQVLGITVNNPADPRGFFMTNSTSGGTITNWGIYSGSSYIKYTGFLPCSAFSYTSSGTSVITLGTTAFTACDFILFAFTNGTVGNLVQSLVDKPVPYLWYQIISGQTTGSTVTLDRSLPNLAQSPSFSGGCNGSIQIQYWIYPGCSDPINTFYGSACTTSYWNTGTLSFDSACEISCADVKVWNQNNVWCEDMLGTQAETETHRQYGSINYIGEKNYLGFLCDCFSATTLPCDTPIQSYDDQVQKGIGILHYTNNTISNFYGEFFFIDTTRNKILTIEVPTVMWHHRLFSGSTTGNKIGMKFVTSGDVKTVINTNIEYYDLMEDPSMSLTPDCPLVVGRVYPQLKIIAISDEELLAAMSYKSNRNWTLPKLNASLTSPTGTTIGLLAPNETMFLTYGLDPSQGFKQALPCQKYIKITNATGSAKDVYFTLEQSGLLPYMQQLESSNYNGFGFYAHQFALYAQKVSNSDCRPDPTLWRKITWTDPLGQSLDPLIIENQNPAVNDFLLNGVRYSGGSIYNINVLSVPNITQTTMMNFGDERFFYGNLNTYIGAKIFKTIFSININRNQYTTTTNPTYGTTNNGTLNISDIGIYDNFGDLVMIGKISTPIQLPVGAVANIEMTLDF
jgi:hypothetical protein